MKCANLLSAVSRKGLAKLENAVAKTLLQAQMFPSLTARETYVEEAHFTSWKQGNVSESSQNIFTSFTQILLSKRMFYSLSTQRNISETMFPQQCILV